MRRGIAVEDSKIPAVLSGQGNPLWTAPPESADIEDIFDVEAFDAP